MSLADLKKERLHQLKQSITNCQGFSFRESLAEAFQLDGRRTFSTPIPKESYKPLVFMEPIITSSKTIRPIMSVQKEQEKEAAPIKKETHIEEDTKEDSEDLVLIAESAELLLQRSFETDFERRSEILKRILNLPIKTLCKLPQLTDFTSWPEETVSDLCKKMQSLESSSYSASSFLVEAVVYPKVVEAKTTLSRLLMNSILGLAKDQGKLVLDCLVVPVLFQCSAERPQIDVVGKISSEALKPGQRLSLLQLILSDGQTYYSSKQNTNINRYSLRPWSEAIFQLIGSILSSQPLLVLTKETLEEILQTIRSAVDSNPKDKSSMQLLLVVTSKYAQAVAEFECIEIVEKTMNSSKMFLKRAVLGQISSIKKKQKVLQESKMG